MTVSRADAPKLSDLKFGQTVRDRITCMKGRITGKFERESGNHFVYIEGIDNTGRSFAEYIELHRVELDL